MKRGVLAILSILAGGPAMAAADRVADASTPAVAPETHRFTGPLEMLSLAFAPPDTVPAHASPRLEHKQSHDEVVITGGR